jgi:hypothetical protein
MWICTIFMTFVCSIDFISIGHRNIPICSKVIRRIRRLIIATTWISLVHSCLVRIGLWVFSSGLFVFSDHMGGREVTHWKNSTKWIEINNIRIISESSESKNKRRKKPAWSSYQAMHADIKRHPVEINKCKFFNISREIFVTSQCFLTYVLRI